MKIQSTGFSKLAKKADVDTRGLRVRFHLFRKVFISIARSMIGLSDDQIKMPTGKRVEGDMNPYYVNVELKPLFQKVSEKSKLTGAVNNNQLAS